MNFTQGLYGQYRSVGVAESDMTETGIGKMIEHAAEHDTACVVA